ncbi:MAG: 5-formyltetrahydrofolate cyclo-ligase, partial [Myxococcota bacterium]
MGGRRREAGCSLSVADEKRRIRSEMEALRRAVDPGTALRAGREAHAHLAGAAEYAACRRLVCYAELAGELPVAAALDAALVAGRQLLWPRIGPGDSLEFAACARVEDLARGRYGVRE